MTDAKTNLRAKLQAFADTLDINEARVEIDSKNLVWLTYRRIGCDQPSSFPAGLMHHGIRYIKGQMKRFEATL